MVWHDYPFIQVYVESIRKPDPAIIDYHSHVRQNNLVINNSAKQ